MPNFIFVSTSVAELAHGEKLRTQSIDQSINHPAYLMPREPNLLPRNLHFVSFLPNELQQQRVGHQPRGPKASSRRSSCQSQPDSEVSRSMYIEQFPSALSDDNLSLNAFKKKE